MRETMLKANKQVFFLLFFLHASSFDVKLSIDSLIIPPGMLCNVLIAAFAFQWLHKIESITQYV